MKSKVFRLFNILIIIVFLVGCARNSTVAPVRDVSTNSKGRVDYHIVNKGETLYSIAWRYNLDFKSLARVNKISRNFAIYPGQKLVLNSVAAKQPWKPEKKRSKTTVNKVDKPTRANKPVRSKKESSPQDKQTHRSVSSASIDWSWPAKGILINKFNGKGGLHKGIDLKGNLGEPVYAAAAGEVVYAGSGLRGYGKLLIVKHSEKFLSAYAHNSRLMVTEGSKVKKGQQIAEMGSSDTDSVKLHFEIRYDGKPVDPLRYLPKKTR